MDNPGINAAPSSMDIEVAIKVENLAKSYKLYNSPLDRLKEALSPIRRKYHHDFHALHNVSFEVKKGESVGIIGKNGSGKSTLLKIITGVLTPSAGAVKVAGKISALLELGAGFNPELTGLENVYFNGTLMGYSRDEMDAKLESILGFADIGEFINQPVKTYSSGMFVRLAFSVASNVEPEIMIVDEALSVGDIFFQQKCYAKIREIISSGTTCLFVSHDTAAMMNLCSKAILLNNGVIDYEGSTEGAVGRYYSEVGNKTKSQSVPVDRIDLVSQHFDKCAFPPAEISSHSILNPNTKRHGAGGMRIVAVRVTDSDGRDTFDVSMMDSLNFYLLIVANKLIVNPNVGIHLYDRLGNLVFSAGAHELKYTLPDLMPGHELLVKIEVAFNVKPGEYTFSLGTAGPLSEDVNLCFTHDRVEMLGPIRVMFDDYDNIPFYGLAQLPMKVSVINAQQETNK